MAAVLDLSTRATLLGRLFRSGSADEDAWREFVNHYGRQIYKWCRHWRLQDADAEEVTQNVLLKLVTRLATFAYDPSRSFRAWLKTLTHNAWVDYLESLKTQGAGGDGSVVMHQLQSVEARDDLVQRLQEEFDHEIMEEAMARVRERVEPQTWEAFRLLSVEGLSGSEAAARIPMKEAMVFIARGRVLKLLSGWGGLGGAAALPPNARNPRYVLLPGSDPYRMGVGGNPAASQQLVRGAQSC